MNEPGFDSSVSGPVRVDRWPTELPLFVLVILGALAIWVFLIASVVGIMYAAFIGVFLFFTHLSFVAHLRGSAVLIGSEQFPDLHARVQELAARAGIRRVPDAYLLQAGGALNAVATKFLRSRFIVLYSDLLEACGSDQQARDMIIGHELGHIKAGHLNGMWFLFPGFLIPFLGSACSRAREYTCDRYGLALCRERRGALAGLAVLAAGREHAPRVNLQALAHQKAQMNTGWMTLGKWLAGHPPLCDRVAALDPDLTTGMTPSIRGPLLASVGVILFCGAWLGGLGYFAVKKLPEFRRAFAAAAKNRGTAARPESVSPSDGSDATRGAVEKDFKALADIAETFRNATGKYPADATVLYATWRSVRRAPEPIDPYTGDRYHYEPNGDQFLLWSVGPDMVNGTDDDIHYFGGAKVSPP